MNSTVGTNGGSANISFREKAINDLAYSIGFSVVVLVVLVVISYISYKCNRSWSSADTNSNYTNSSFSFPHPVAGSIIITSQGGGGGGGGHSGLDEDALVNYPKFLYSQAKLVKGDDPIIASGCSICLADYKDADMLRLLPECGHLFHLNCIDPWLKLHPTCPICRSSPHPTPLAEVVPMSIHQN